MDDMLREFLTETAESLAVLDAELVRFEQDPDNAETLGNIFRLVHTIKGTCGFLGLPRLESIAHAGENVLGKFRDRQLEVTPQAVTAILKCIDKIRVLLAALEESGSEPSGDDSALLSELADIAQGKAPAAPQPPAAAEEPAVVAPVVSADGFPVAAELLAEVNAATKGASAAPAAAPAKPESKPAVEAEALKPKAEPKQPAAAPAAEPARAIVPTRQASAPSEEPTEAKGPAVAQQSIRVPVETLESLMNMVSELVLTRNQLLQMVRGRTDTQFSAPLQRLSHITSELQEGVMKTRMQPIGNAWSKLPRIVRDLAHETGKKLDLQMQGEGTELDRQVLELIRDPFIHMVRNAADHGIETPEDRRRSGKPETGVIRLAAHHEGGHIIIKVSDDGRGLNLEKIKDKILTNGLAREAELAQMSDQQIYQFVFRAGFSTAEKVTSVSGRGVGMDVVRTNIEKIGGNIELSSTPGQGSTITVKIPLTLAIVSALIVAAGAQRFALPQICVMELVRVGGSGDAKIETIRETPLLRLRDRLLPLIDLRSLLQISGGNRAHGISESLEAFVIVTQVGQLRFGIIVDEVFDTEEIVVKPVSPLLRGIRYYAGNTILGDGGVVMILDPNGVAQMIGQQAAQTETETEAAERDSRAKLRLLVFRAGAEGIKAVPLDLVARLEEVDLANIERAEGRPMIQYRGKLMPLIPCDPTFDWPHEGRRPVLVFADRGQSMGLVVDEIVDIVEEHVVIELNGQRPGFVGSALVDGKATEIIDAAHHLTQAFPSWFEPASGRAHTSDNRAPRLLVVEDSAFFRGLLKPVLEAEGYRVTAVEDADRALALREEGETFDAIISDIEMPGMNGFQFAKHVREQGGRWSELPILALSSHSTEQYLQQGRSVGFTDYIAKFDRDGLMSSLAKTLHEGHA